MITSYLEVAAGGHSFLLASGMIREVWQAAYAPSAPPDTHGWRGHACPLIDCRVLFGIEASDITERTFLAYGEGYTPLIIAVDRVVTLRQIEDDALHPLPTGLAPLNRCFDRIVGPDADGRLMLRWRGPGV
jgi:chemotaxis signal transduction protein